MRAKFTRNAGFESKKPQVGGRKETVKITDIVEMYEWPSKGSGQVRVVGPIEGRGTHKIKVTKKDGSEVEISKTCLAFDIETDDRDLTKKCPYCKLPSELAKFGKAYFFNVIDRRLVEEAPAKMPKPTAEEIKTGFKMIGTKTWTPMRVCRLPSGGALRMQSLGDKNLVLDKKTKTKKKFPVNHPSKGFDLDISFDKKKPAANMYELDRNQDERYTPLTEEEQEYPMWNIELVYPAEEYEDAKKEAEGLLKRSGLADGDDEEDGDDDDDDEPKSKSKKPVKKGSKKPVDDEDDEDDEEEDLDLDDEEDEPKPAKKKAKKPVDDEEEEEEDDEEEDDEEDEEEEDEPAPKKKAASKTPAKKKRAEPEEEDEEEDEEDEEEEEDEPAPKKGAKKSKKPVDDEDDLDDLDDDEDDSEEEDEEEEDEPSPKKKATAKKPALKKKTR